MSVQSGQSVTVEFTTRSFTTGGQVNADSLPTATLVVNGADNAASVTITNITTGRYKAAVTLPTLSIGDYVELVALATVGGVTDGSVVYRDTKDILLPSSGDPLGNQVPGTYPGGSAGYVLGHLDPTNVTVQSPVDPSGNIALRIGDDYKLIDGNELPFESSGVWADLTGATIAFELWQPSSTTALYSFAGVVLTPTGDQQVYVEISRTQMSTISPGQYSYRLQATLATVPTLGDVNTLAFGVCLVTRP